MYKGHLNLMYGLYQFMSGDERFAKEYTWLTRQIVAESGLYWHQYHPLDDVVETSLSGYTNAWSMVMLNYFEPEYNAGIYPKWKERFVVEIGPYAYVKEEPGGGVSQLATAYGLLAAREFRDVELFTKLRNSLDRFGGLGRVAVSDTMEYAKGDNTIANGMIFAFKIHAGWQQILENGRGPAKPTRIPRVDHMVWTDLLPNEIHESYIPPAAIPNF